MSILISRVNFPVEVKYGFDKIIVPPNGQIKNIENAKLAKPLPKGLMVIDK